MLTKTSRELALNVEKGQRNKTDLRRTGRIKGTRQSSRVTLTPAVRKGIKMPIAGKRKKMQAKGIETERTGAKVEEL